MLALESAIKFLVIVIGIAVGLGLLVETLQGNLFPPPAPRPVATERVYIEDSYFSPEAISVKAGVQVTWEQNGSITHNVVFTNTPSLVKSPLMARGSTFPWTFTAPGTYHYYCSLHPNNMRGTVVVQP